MSEEQKEQEVKKQNTLPALEKMEGEGIDLTQYVGMPTSIELLEIKSGVHGSYLEAKTKILGQSNGKDIRASVIFSLKNTDKGIGIPEKGKLSRYMATKKVEDYRKLLNMPVVVLSEADDKGMDWLIFN